MGGELVWRRRFLVSHNMFECSHVKGGKKGAENLGEFYSCCGEKLWLLK